MALILRSPHSAGLCRSDVEKTPVKARSAWTRQDLEETMLGMAISVA